MITWGFDMTRAKEDLLSFYVDEPDLNCYGHMFQSANEQKRIGIRTAFINLVSNQW